ncbi:helix-turn-helix transcriptional regulator (plasmid) [Deinococcus sp. KNUC1210]|uniref:PadR family transcriptional regulator n=1 Tax=Deinococcus sp. KNUC1210 TaxID=2917691 RepID=UPI001EEFC8E1|nr:helix-turn-helix transcriptional regulator [Deinococcus sp. KNUC1210]ULH13986.1 helix-turn-helix transcriptional regulator [Deinococcus sp. KNUC1210]
MDPNLLKGHLDLILLAALEHEPKYGGQITQEVKTRTDGAFQFKEGSLYPALHRLEKAGWVLAEFHQLPRGGTPVRFYTLTESGRRALDDKRDTYYRFQNAVRTLVGGNE